MYGDFGSFRFYEHAESFCVYFSSAEKVLPPIEILDFAFRTALCRHIPLRGIHGALDSLPLCRRIDI
jgi:hypothetical protein